MQVRVKKCAILVGAGRADIVTPARGQSFFQVFDKGITVLGNPVGTDVYRKAELEGTIRSMSVPLPTLNRIHSTQAAFAL